MFDPKKFDPLSPGLRRMLDRQEKMDRLLHVDRLSDRYAWITKRTSPLPPHFSSPFTGVLADLERSQARLVAGPVARTDLSRSPFSAAVGSHRMLERLLDTPLASAMQWGGVKDLGSISRILPAEQFQFGMGRLACVNVSASGLVRLDTGKLVSPCEHWELLALIGLGKRLAELDAKII